MISAAHDGFQRLPGKPVHRRQWQLAEDRLVVTDRIEGDCRSAVARFHLHPQVEASIEGTQGALRLTSGACIRWRVTGGHPSLAPDTWHPEFGCSLPSKCLEVVITGDQCALELTWTASGTASGGRAAATKPFGFTPYYPGPGLGGHCIPIDPFYLTWKAREYGLNTRFIELAGEVNTAMPEWVVGKVADALNARGKPVKGARILVLGIAYKKNVDDRRESPSMILMELLEEKGAEISYADPHVPRFLPMRKHDFDLESVPLTAETLAATDCVLLATDHDRFDYDLIKAHAPLIVDTRGRYREPAVHIVHA